MDMLPVHMNADHGFIPRQMLLRELLGDFQCQFRGDLSRFEGLDHVVILHAVRLAYSPFGVQHLAALPAWVAVQMGGEDALLGLVPIEDVVDADVQAALPGQDFCDGHRLPQNIRVNPFEFTLNAKSFQIFSFQKCQGLLGGLESKFICIPIYPRNFL